MPNEFGKDSLTYEGVGAAKHWERIESYGPKIVENYLAIGTLVLTDRGLVSIERITDEMLIWDGTEWVSHDGLIYQEVKTTVEIGGVFMTPEHRILTEGAWIESAKASGLNWAEVLLPEGYSESGEHCGRQGLKDMLLCLWQGNCSQSSLSSGQEISCEILRMHEELPSFTSE